MGIAHIFDGIGNDFAGGQTIEHPVVPHGNSIINGNGIKFLGHATRLRDFLRNQLAQIAQVNMAWDKLGKGIGNGDDRLAKIIIRHPRRPPKPARARHIASVCRCFRAIVRHRDFSFVYFF